MIIYVLKRCIYLHILYYASNFISIEIKVKLSLFFTLFLYIKILWNTIIVEQQISLTVKIQLSSTAIRFII